jgi:hypothetical protein
MPTSPASSDSKIRPTLYRLLIALLVLFAPAVASAQTATVTGHALNPSGSAASNASVCFSLQNFKPNVPRVVGTGVIVRQQNWCITPSTVDGSFSVPIDRNDLISPNGTYWRVDYLLNGLQQSSASYVIASATFNLDSATPIATAPTVGPSSFIAQTFNCAQVTAATTWTCVHNFADLNVAVTVYDQNNNQIFPNTLTTTDFNTVTLTFVAPQAGRAVIIHGGAVSIATNQPNAILGSGMTGPQSISSAFSLTINAPTSFTNTNTHSGAETFCNLGPGIFIVGPSACPSLQTTLNSAASTGGEVMIPSGFTVTTTSTVAIPGGVLLNVRPGATLQVNINSPTTDAIQVTGSYGGVTCGKARSSANGAIRGVSQASTSVRTMVSVSPQNGSIEAAYVEGCQFSDVTVSRAVIDGSATFNNTAIRDNIVFNVTGSATAPGILVASGTGATGAVGAVEITNNWVNPGTNTAGIILNGVDPGGLGAAPILGVKVGGNQIEHTGTAPMMQFTGNATNGVQNVTAWGNWFLPTNTVPNGYKIVDVVTCQQCTFTGTSFLPVAVTANPLYGFYLESSVAGGVTDFHSLSPSLNSFAQANFIHVHNDNAAQNKDNPAFSDYIGISIAQGSRLARMQDESGRGYEFGSQFPGFPGSDIFGIWGSFGQANPGATASYVTNVTNPAASRDDPGGNANYCFSLGCSLTSPALTTPTIGGETISASPRILWSSFTPAASGVNAIAKMTIDKAITVTRVDIFSAVAPSGCATNAVLGVTDGTTAVNVTVSSANNDSGAIAQNYAAGAILSTQVSTAASGCTTAPSNLTVTVQYRMQ